MRTPAFSTCQHLHICVLTRVAMQHGVGGGMERHAETLRQGLVSRGHRVTTITTPHPQGVQQQRDTLGATYFVGSGRPLVYSRAWWRASTAQLLDLHARDPFDVVVGHGKAVYAYLAQRRRFPTTQQIPVVVITHNNIIRDFQQQLTQVRHRPLGVLRWVPRGLKLYVDDLRYLPLAERITALSDSTGDALRHWFRLDQKRITVIFNGVDVEACLAAQGQRPSWRRHLLLADDTVLIVAIGRLVNDKGHQYLIDAFASLTSGTHTPLCQLVIAGDGPLRAALQAQAQQRGVARDVTFLGHVAHDEALALMQAADVMAHPSLVEGLPLTLLEAMACGRPIIASQVGAIAQWLVDGVSGLLIPAANSSALTHALSKLVGNPHFGARLGEQAQHTLRARGDQRLMVEQFEAVLSSAAAAGAKPSGG